VAPEAFARWAEAGAVQSIMQVGGGSNHAGWDDFLLDVADAFIASLKLKMSLWPMFEAALAAASRGGDGTPAMVPLGVVMGQDAEAWADPYATALFDARLVAYPVVEDGARTRGARLPAGDWIELRTGARTTGPATVTVDAPLGALPLFVRAGAALVLDEDSDALLPTSAAGRLGPQARRVLVVSAGPASETIADGLDVRQAPASDGGVNVRVTRARAGPLTIRAYGAFTAVDAGGAIVSELRPGAGFVEVDVESDGAVDVTLR
jgi:alpha-glucosidase (family GH31 glycosyl hydrolase)